MRKALTQSVISIAWAAWLIGCAPPSICPHDASIRDCGLKEPVTLKVVTFNIQDLPFKGKYCPERMRAIADKLCGLDPDIVGFQEAFVGRDRKILTEKLTQGSRLKHHRYYRSGVVGSGVLISSAFPIRSWAFCRYTKSNPFYKLREGDWWAGKGAALARIELPGEKGFVSFYDTHAQAAYKTAPYLEVRKSQMAELARFISESRGGAPVLLAGDMNCTIGSEPYDIVVQQAGLTRLMTVATRIDHIFGANDARYKFAVLETREIRDKVRVNDTKTVDLSNHPGYMSIIEIKPVH